MRRTVRVHLHSCNRIKGRYRALSDGGFDRKYIAEMVKDHEKDVKTYEKMSKEVTDVQVKQYMETTLPVLKEHLQMARPAQQWVVQEAPQ